MQGKQLRHLLFPMLRHHNFSCFQLWTLPTHCMVSPSCKPFMYCIIIYAFKLQVFRPFILLWLQICLGEYVLWLLVFYLSRLFFALFSISASFGLLIFFSFYLLILLLGYNSLLFDVLFLITLLGFVA